MNKTVNFILIISLSFVTYSCFHATSSDVQQCIDLVSNEMKHSKTSFIFVGAQWCKPCKTMLKEQFLQNPLLQEDSIGAMIIYFSNESYMDSLLLEANDQGSFHRFDSYSGLDKMVANALLKKIIPNYKDVNYMPIMLRIDSLGNYSHWNLVRSSFFDETQRRH